MIITCPSCDKKFNVDASLIPNEGRTLQCGFCERKWHYKLDRSKQKNEYKKKDVKIKKIDPYENISSEVDKLITDAENSSRIKETSSNIEATKINFSVPFFNLLLLSIITLSSTLLILDTFKSQINLIYPNFNFILNNFYETLKDLYFFFKDLIR
tara:strand:- start:757 stop:1221 length:465 start_codon:yes stop_codon:yes gene_type:complete